MNAIHQLTTTTPLSNCVLTLADRTLSMMPTFGQLAQRLVDTFLQGNTTQLIQHTYRLSYTYCIRNSSLDLINILTTCDILAVQEHWLPKQSQNINSLHSDFSARGISSIDYGDGFSGRPHGGLCFLWRRSLDPSIEIWVYDDEKRLLGLKITTSNATILVLNVYLPYQSDDNADEYQAILGKIQAISDSFDSSNIFIVGDFNADLIKTSLFSPFLNYFISECHFIPSDIKYLPPDSFTYVSDAHGSRSWLDHVLCTHSLIYLSISLMLPILLSLLAFPSIR